MEPQITQKDKIDLENTEYLAEEYNNGFDGFNGLAVLPQYMNCWTLSKLSPGC